jgi:MoxR-like ATPase
MAEANGGMFKTPILCGVSDSNFMPDPDDPHLGALVDRLGLMQLVEYVKADDSFKEMFRRHHERTTGGAGSSATATVSLDQLVAAQEQVRQIRPGADFLDKYAELRRNARGEGLMVSDRTFMELGLVARASAWLAGRDQLVPEDLAAIEPGLWRDKSDIPLAHKLVLPFHGRFERDAAKYRQEAAPALEKVAEIRPLVEGTPPGEELDQAVVTKAISASRKIAAVKRRVDTLLTEAEKEQRDAADARDLSNELRGVQEWFKANDLPHNMDD